MTDEGAEALAAAGPTRERLWTAVAALERAASAPAPGRAPEWRARCAAALDAVRAEWQAHTTAAESADGLFDEIVERAPRLAHATDRLRQEHIDLAAAMEADAAAVAAADDEPAVAIVRGRLVELLGRLALHRHRGVDLVYEAYDVDISAGD